MEAGFDFHFWEPSGFIAYRLLYPTLMYMVPKWISYQLLNIYCFQKLDDINENGIQEFLVCNKKTIYLIEPTPSKINFLKVTSDFRNNRLSFGSVGDYNSDRIKDFWVVNPYYKSGIDEKVTGYAGLIDGKKILASFNSKKEKIQLNELIIKEIPLFLQIFFNISNSFKT